VGHRKTTGWGEQRKKKEGEKELQRGRLVLVS
jgi:hypothetical protein